MGESGVSQQGLNKEINFLVKLFAKICIFLVKPLLRKIRFPPVRVNLEPSLLQTSSLLLTPTCHHNVHRGLRESKRFPSSADLPPGAISSPPPSHSPCLLTPLVLNNVQRLKSASRHPPASAQGEFLAPPPPDLLPFAYAKMPLQRPSRTQRVQALPVIRRPPTQVRSGHHPSPDPSPL